MSAAIFGANLLEEVQEVGLDEVLSDLRWSVAPEPTGISGIPELDRLIDLFHYSHGTAVDEHQEDWTSSSPGRHEGPSTQRRHSPQSTTTQAKGTKHKFPLIEIGHSGPSTGKTTLLHHIAAASILPRIHNGKESTVVWLDTDASFSATRIHDICIGLLNKSAQSVPQSEQQSIAVESLRHLHVFSLSSSAQLISTLDSLESYLFQSLRNHIGQISIAHHSLYRPLSLIILDSATAFYWTDRFDADLVRLESATSPTQIPSVLPNPVLSNTARILTKLRSLQAKLACACIYSTTYPPSRLSRVSNTGTAGTTPLRFLPAESDGALSAWTWAATLSLTMTRLPVPQFTSHMTLEDCLRDRKMRQEVVGQGRVRIGICEEWIDGAFRERRVKESLEGIDGRGAFVVRIGARGVEIE